MLDPIMASLGTELISYNHNHSDYITYALSSVQFTDRLNISQLAGGWCGKILTLSTLNLTLSVEFSSLLVAEKKISQRTEKNKQ